MKKLLALIKVLIIAQVVGLKAKKALVRGIIKEHLDEDYFPQEDFDTCRERVYTFFKEVLEPLVDWCILATARHRKDAHDEDRDEEILEATKALSVSQTETSISSSGYWAAD